MKKSVIFGVVFSTACLFSLSVIRSAQKPNIPQPKNVSMVQLLAAPEKFYGKMVSVVGFLGIEKDDARLYLSEEDYRRYIPDNGVWVDVNRQMLRDIEQIDIHYVIVVGAFKQKGEQIHFFGAGDGGITDIRQCTPWLEPSERRPRKQKPD
jgi:hypothetical protein